MVRPLRIEYAGAVYHVTARGGRREPIAKDNSDRRLFFDILGEALQRFDAQAWAYCLMDNHYHLVLHTREANLSRLMRQINGVVTRHFNCRHRQTAIAPAFGVASSTVSRVVAGFERGGE